MSVEANSAIARRWNGELFGGGDLEWALAAADRLVASDFVDHATPPGLAPGLEGLKQQITIFFRAFPDLGSVVDDVIAEHDRVVVRWHGWGTQRGEFFGLPPTGRFGTTTGIHIFRIADGKIAEH